MSTAVGIASTYGITLGSNAKPQRVQRVRSVAYSEVPGVDGEAILVKGHKMLRTEVTISGIGNTALTGVAIGPIGTPADLKQLRAENGEVNDNRGNFSFTASGVSAFTDGSSDGGDAGAGSPTVATVEVVSVAYSLTKECKVSVEMDEAVELTPAGVPGYREGFNRRFSFSASGKGDIPADVGPGSGGAKHAGVTGGVTVVPSVTDTQEVRAVNGWSFEALNWPGATAG
jgi:hypothetical protein